MTPTTLVALVCTLVVLASCTPLQLRVPPQCKGTLPNATAQPSHLFNNRTFDMIRTFVALVEALPTVVEPTNITYRGNQTHYVDEASIAVVYNRSQPLPNVLIDTVYNLTVLVAQAATAAKKAADSVAKIQVVLKGGNLTDSMLKHMLAATNETINTALSLSNSATILCIHASDAFYGMDSATNAAVSHFDGRAMRYAYVIQKAEQEFAHNIINASVYNKTLAKYEPLWYALNVTAAINKPILETVNGQFQPPERFLFDGSDLLLHAGEGLADASTSIPGLLLVEKNKVILNFRLGIFADTILQGYETLAWIWDRACMNVYLQQH
jgi:hypothetical protein